MKRVARHFAGNRLALTGGVIVVVTVVVSLGAPLLPLADPDATDLGSRLEPPLSSGHVLGTDPLGRDLLARIVWGTRTSLGVGFVATAAATLIGTLIGILAAYYGRVTDTLLMRGIDMMMAFPYLLLALAIVAALGPGLRNAMLAIAVVNVPFFARGVRGVVLSIKDREYVLAARSFGMGDARILARQIVPNVLPGIVIMMATTTGWMILETAGLSFLGLGAQPPQADLGSMLGQGRSLITTHPHVAALPGAVIFILVVGINLLGDGLRETLDPQLRGRE